MKFDPTKNSDALDAQRLDKALAWATKVAATGAYTDNFRDIHHFMFVANSPDDDLETHFQDLVSSMLHIAYAIGADTDQIQRQMSSAWNNFEGERDEANTLEDM
jgi:hypothetical protein